MALERVSVRLVADLTAAIQSSLRRTILQGCHDMADSQDLP